MRCSHRTGETLGQFSKRNCCTTHEKKILNRTQIACVSNFFFGAAKCLNTDDFVQGTKTHVRQYERGGVCNRYAN